MLQHCNNLEKTCSTFLKLYKVKAGTGNNMIHKILISVLALMLTGMGQAHACTSISVRQINAGFITSQKNGMIPFKVDVFCANPSGLDITAKLRHSSSTKTNGNSDFAVYKNGIMTTDENKILNVRVLDRQYAAFEPQDIRFTGSNTTTNIDFYLSIADFTKKEPGNYTGMISFDVEY